MEFRNPPPTFTGRTSAEFVSDGHPDKLCDQFGDAILDACLEQDPDSRVAVEAACKGHDVFLLGEITSRAEVDLAACVRRVLEGVGHGDGRWGLDPRKVRVHRRITQQSPEIAAAVSGGGALGAGDQGVVWGFACDENPERMPAEWALARALLLRLRDLRRTPEGAALGPDAKSLVVLGHNDGHPVSVQEIVISTQHAPGEPLARVRELLMEEVVRRVVPPEWLHRETHLHLNPGGPFTSGGPVADAGLSGRKLQVDAYGPHMFHGGGAFSGKDGTKVDRAAAYAARRVALAMVDTGRYARVTISANYAIGSPGPLAGNVSFQEKGPGPTPACREAYEQVAARLFAPAAMLRELELTRPIFAQVAAWGHFGRPELDLPWERPIPEFAALAVPEPSDRDLQQWAAN